MQVKKFTASNMREALKEITDTLGKDAIILSNKKNQYGVEVLAAKEQGKGQFSQTQPNNASVLINAQKQNSENADPVAPNQSTKTFTTSIVEKQKEEVNRQIFGDKPAKEFKPQVHDVDVINKAMFSELTLEVQTLNRLVSHQLNGLAWQHFKNLEPVQSQLLQKLYMLGFPASHAFELVKQVTHHQVLPNAWQELLSYIVAALEVNRTPLIEQNRIISLVGPSGSGKTSVLSKLAANFLLENDAKDLALISLDDARIGGFDQLKSFGQLLNINVFLANNMQSLDEALNKTINSKLVLIDTPGAGLQDEKLKEMLAMFHEVPFDISNALVMPVNVNYETLNHYIQLFGPSDSKHVILSKTDEAQKCGAIVSLLLQHNLQTNYISSGKHLVEGIKIADEEQILNLLLANIEVLDPFWDDIYAIEYARIVS